MAALRNGTLRQDILLERLGYCKNDCLRFLRVDCRQMVRWA